MKYTYNQIRFLEKIITSTVGVIICIATPFIFLYSPANLIYIIISIFLLVIGVIIFEGYLILLKGEAVSRKFVYIMPFMILLLLYFMIIAIVGLVPIGLGSTNFPFINQLNALTGQVWFTYFPYGLLVLAFIVEIPIVISMESLPYETYFTRERVIREGIAAKAKILNLQDKGLRMDGYPFYTLTLEITSPNNGTYTITRNLMVPDFDLRLMQVGQTVDVKIDPRQPKKVFLDTWTGDLSDQDS